MLGLVMAISAPPPAISAKPPAISAPPQTREVTRVEYTTREQVAAVARYHAHFELDEGSKTLLLETTALDRERLRALGLQLSQDPKATAAIQAVASRLADQTRGINGFPCYRTVAEVQSRLTELASSYPNLVQILDVGDSWNRLNGFPGHDMVVLKLGRRDQPSAGKPRFFIMSSVHAREYTPAELNLRFAEWLLQNYQDHADARWLLDNQEFHILVHANPDGRTLAETQIDQRKNTNRNFCLSSRVGVDLNRNFPFGWGAFNGSSPNACDDTFRGSSPTSEPETQSIWSYVQTLFPDVRGPGLNDAAPNDTPGLFIDMHSFSNLVLWPWGFTAQASGNALGFEALGRRLAWFNRYRPQRAVDLYVTDGTTIDTVYGELGTPALVFELGNAFFESCSMFEQEIYPRNLQALIYAAKATRAPYQLPQGPELRELQSEPDLALSGESIRISAIADDSRFNQSFGGTQTSQIIQGVRFSMATPIWQSGAESLPMSASDGAFDANREAVRADVSGAQLPAGESILYTQAEDALGNKGPVSAQFVNVLAPAAVGTLVGDVRVAGSGAAIPGASIESGRYRSLSNSLGQFTRRLPAGSGINLKVSAEGFETTESLIANLAGGSTQPISLAMLPLCERLREDANTPLSGWTTGGTGGTWGIQAADALFATGSISDSPNGNYANSANFWLQAPNVNLSADSSVQLSFDMRCDVDPFDFARIEVRPGSSGTWREIYRCDADTSVRRVTVSMQPLAGATQAQIRFRLNSDSAGNRDGWRLDNLRLRATGTACRSTQTSLFRHGFEAL